MADFSRKPRLCYADEPELIDNPSASVCQQDLLRFKTKNPKRPAEIDLYEFVTGVTEDEAPKLRKKPFSGRQELIRELAPAIYKRYLNAPETTVKQLYATLRWWWRFFDSFDSSGLHESRFNSALQWDHIHYAHYRFGHLKGVRFCQDATASIFFTLLTDVRKKHGMPFWWAAIGTPDKQREPVSDNDLRKLYQYFKTYVRKAMLRMETAAACSIGKVPLADSSLLVDLTPSDRHGAPTEPKPHDSDPAPTADEVRAFIVLFILYSGWNPQVVLDIDLGLRNDRGGPDCIRPSFLNPDTHSRVLSRKMRAGNTLQQAEGRNRESLSPANLLLFMERHTTELRSLLRSQLEELKTQRRSVDKSMPLHADLEKRIDRITQQLRSPWLFRSRSVNHKGIGCILSTDHLSFRMKQRDYQPVAWATKLINENFAERRKVFTDRGENFPPHLEPIADGIVLTDLRDAFIIWRYENSGYSWLEGLLASGSSGLDSIISYLNKKRLKYHAAREITKVTNTFWDTVKLESAGDMHFSIVVAARLNGVTEQQIAERIARTSSGTGCRDINSPPARLRKKPNSPCAADRCLICHENAILITDERGANDIARVRAELNHVKKKLSVVAWMQSDWPLELANIEAVWEKFDQPYINKRLEWWERRIATGEHIPPQI